MFDQIVTYIRSRSRSQWRQIAEKLFSLVRDWLNRQGEIAAVIGVVVGIVFVLFFQIILVSAVVLSLLGFALYSMANED